MTILTGLEKIDPVIMRVISYQSSSRTNIGDHDNVIKWKQFLNKTIETPVFDTQWHSLWRHCNVFVSKEEIYSDYSSNIRHGNDLATQREAVIPSDWLNSRCSFAEIKRLFSLMSHHFNWMGISQATNFVFLLTRLSLDPVIIMFAATFSK